MARWWFCALLLLLATPALGANEAPKAEPYPELLQARKNGWQLARLILENLEQVKAEESPGIHAWVQDVRKATQGMDLLKTPVEKWPALDADALVTRNPNFWRAYFEIAPGDPGLALLHAGLLMAAGEAARAQYVAVIAWQRPGIPAELRQGLAVLINSGDRLISRAGREVQAGIEKFDVQDYDGAARQFRQVLARWPQYGFAHYELAMTIWYLEEIKAGRQPPPAAGVSVPASGKDERSAEVKKTYARSRQHDPFQVRAYQGYERSIEHLRPLLNKTLPAWKALVGNYAQGTDQKEMPAPVGDDVLQNMAAGCQAAGIHDLAITARQILAARRGRYDPADHPFLAASLRKLAPGQDCEATLQQLAGPALKVRQLVRPEAGRAHP